MSGDPIVYATLMEDRLRELNDQLGSQAELASHGLEKLFDGEFFQPLREMLKRAYVQGVCDGFAQGVAVEADSSAGTIRQLDEAIADLRRNQSGAIT